MKACRICLEPHYCDCLCSVCMKTKILQRQVAAWERELMDQMTKDVIVALGIVENYLEKGQWVHINTWMLYQQVHVKVGHIHNNGMLELEHITFTVKGGVVTKASHL